MNPIRLVRDLGLIAAGLLALSSPAIAAEPSLWVGSWMASPQPIWSANFPLPLRVPEHLGGSTVRQVVRLSLGGRRIRLVFANTYGIRPLHLADVHVNLRGLDRRVTFSGRSEASVRPEATLTSDPIDLAPTALSRMTVSAFLPAPTPLATFHWDARETVILAPGDQSGRATLQGGKTILGRVVLSEVLVDHPGARGVVVALGDSITDGAGASVDGDQRWPDVLAERLVPEQIAVLNAGISGARLVRDKMGVKVAGRLDRDVLDQPGVRTVIVLIGINDIAWPGTEFAPNDPSVRIEDLMDGYSSLAARARARGVRVIGATLTPIEGALPDSPIHGYASPAKDQQRQAINNWIRASGVFDGVIDFDALARDPNHPARLRADMDSGDHLHPSDAGDQMMARAIDLKVLLAN